jgi:hypothetical protein
MSRLTALWQFRPFVTKGFKLLPSVLIDLITLRGYLLYNLLLSRGTEPCFGKQVAQFGDRGRKTER